jgi:hypothetical protein
MFEKERTPEQKERQRLLENRAWLDKNFESVQREHANQWIAILDGKIVSHDPDVEVVKQSVEGREGEAVVMRIPVGTIPTPM